MKFSITITGDSPEELKDNALSLAAHYAGGAESDSAPAKEAPKRTRRTKAQMEAARAAEGSEEAAEEAEAPTPVATQVATPAVAPKADAFGDSFLEEASQAPQAPAKITPAELKAKFQDLAKAKGMAAVVEVAKKLGVQQISQLQESRFQEAWSLIEEAMK